MSERMKTVRRSDTYVAIVSHGDEAGFESFVTTLHVPTKASMFEVVTSFLACEGVGCSADSGALDRLASMCESQTIHVVHVPCEYKGKAGGTLVVAKLNGFQQFLVL